MTLTGEDVNRYQHSGVAHPLTCRTCRGWGDCERRDVGLAGGDHHVLRAVERDGTLVLTCGCCGSDQPVDVHTAGFIASWVLPA